MTAQEQALSTRAIEARVYHTRQDLRVQVGDTKILWDFQIQTDKMVVANQPDIVVIDKHQKTVVVIDVAISK
ncbi:hypothetical protein D4764_13G0004670 [Takifugu flavidus]|uniref:Uncharacterized protein n=1 Tax=Takifugu flavidus TaxID=433684 RepID=A0A5C6P8S0_9TELE|nr:hypothetical protein D4764_13G0004670 [Takifugu flavidus]